MALARCLISKPDLVFLDEPTEGIQPSIVDGIIELLQRLNAEQGLSIVLVEQNLEFVTSLSDRVLLLQKGDITGEVGGDESSNSALIEEFVGFGSGVSMSVRQDNVDVSKGAPTDRAETKKIETMQKQEFNYMTVKRPTHDQLKQITQDLGMNLSDERVSEFLEVMEDTMKVYDMIDAMPDRSRRGWSCGNSCNTVFIASSSSSPCSTTPILKLS